MTAPTGSDVRLLAQSCELTVQLELGSAEVCFSPEGGVTKSVCQIGLGPPQEVSEHDVLASPERIVLRTASGWACELLSADVLAWATQLLPPTRKYIAEELQRGAPLALEVLPTPDGALQPAMFSHDDHKAVFPREHVITTAGGTRRVRIARCTDCNLFFVGE